MTSLSDWRRGREKRPMFATDEKAYISGAEAFFMTLRQLNAAAGDKLIDPWTQNPFVRSAVASLYRVVKGVPLVGVTGSRDKPDEAQPLGDNDSLALLLAKPNPIQSGGEFVASLVAYQLLDGAAYVLLYGTASKHWTTTEGDVPREMLPLDPRAVSVAVNGRDPVSGLIRQYDVKTDGGTTMKVAAESMLVLREFNPRDLQAGSAPLAPVWSGMEADRLVDVFSSALLANGANPGVLISLTQSLEPKEKDALRTQFDSRHAGATKAGRTVVTGPGVDLKPFPAQTNKDMEMPALRAWNRDAIKAVLGVTDYEVGRVADYNRANSESARAWLWTNTLLPILNGIEDKLWSHVFDPISRGQRAARWARFDTSKVAALRPDLATTATTAQTLIATGFDPAQVSEKLDLGLDFVDVPTDPTPPPPPVVVPPVPPADTPPPTPAKTGPHIWVKRDAPPGRAIPRRVALRLQQQWAKHAEKQLGVKWRSFTEARYRETIARVRAATDIGLPSQAEIDRFMGSAEDWRKGAEAAAHAGLKGLGNGLAENLGAELGTRIDVGQDIFGAVASKRIGQMVQVSSGLRMRIRDSIVKTLADAGTEGFTVDDLEKVLARKFRGRLPSNAATVARTETGMYAADVRNQLMVSEGVDQKEWMASGDQWTRETHKAIDGERINLDQRFSNGLLHPLEVGAPASEVVNCRCTTLPYMREVED